MNAIMTEFDHHRTSQPHQGNWEGFAEIDQAIREDRLTEYRMKKAWADPINRRVTLFVALILLAFIAFVIINDVIL
ncbi:hypothetical protein [Sphingopyxis chilensis]